MLVAHNQIPSRDILLDVVFRCSRFLSFFFLSFLSLVMLSTIGIVPWSDGTPPHEVCHVLDTIIFLFFAVFRHHGLGGGSRPGSCVTPMRAG
jgi:hypothetical protein